MATPSFEYRVGDLRIISLERRWLKAGVMEDGVIYANIKKTPAKELTLHCRKMPTAMIVESFVSLDEMQTLGN